jgi:hypothetical protein
MSDFQRLVITLDATNPAKSYLELDGQRVDNVFALRVEQAGPDVPMTVELSTYGSRLATTSEDFAIWLHAYCPGCRRSLSPPSFPIFPINPTDQ